MKGLIYMFKRYKVASVLNLLGIVIAFAVCYVVLTQIDYQKSFNKKLDGYENLYRVESIVWFGKWTHNLNRPLAEHYKELPQVEDVAIWCPYNDTWGFEKDGTLVEEEVVKMMPGTMKTFRAKCLDGRVDFNEDESGIIIPASVAQKFFGDTQVAGRSMVRRYDKEEVPIVGVFEDFPSNVAARNVCYINLGDENKGVVNNWNYECDIRLHESVDGATFQDVLIKESRRFLKEFYAHEGADMDNDDTADGWQFRAVPFSETYMSGVSADDKGDSSTLLILQLSCLLIIIVAAINFANFTLAEAPMRIKSINTRKVLGSSVASLRWGLIGEGVVSSLLAYVVAMIIVSQLALVPSVTDIVLGSIKVFDNIPVVLVMLFVAVLVGVLTSLYPSFYVTSFTPALVLKGSFGLSPRGKFLRTVLICFQFVAAFGMVIYLVVMSMQSNYIFKSDYGYDKDALLGFSVGGKMQMEKAEALRQELVNLSSVEDVSYSRCVLGVMDWGQSWGRKSADGNFDINTMAFDVDGHFINVYGIDMAEGESVRTEETYYVVNEAFKKSYQFVEVGQPVFSDDPTIVGGVCKDVRFTTARNDRHNQCCLINIYNGKIEGDMYMPVVTVRIVNGANLKQAREDIRCVVAKFTTDTPDLLFLDDELENTYKDEFRFISQIGWFASVAFVVALIGVFCLTMFETEYRRKEIGIRKVMGATLGEVVNMFVREYLILLIVSYMLAVPVAYIMSSRWLDGFAEHTDLNWLPFALSFVVVSVVTIAIVWLKTIKAAMENPTESIKS